MKIKLQKTNQTEFRTEKVIQRKVDKLYINWKVYDNSFNSWTEKKIWLYKMSYFPEPYTRSQNKKFKLNLPNYATKSDLKNATGVAKSNLPKKVDLPDLKLDNNNFDVD